tara:strand:- start:5639 stop:5923 length:285 start_codon:yes stop_codon:yes gene_type:complete
MDESDLKNIIQKAHRADELLNDPLIQEFIISLRGDLLSKFESTALEDTKARQDAWQQSQVLNKFLDKFTKQIKDGKNAKLTLMDRAKIKLKNVI